MKPILKNALLTVSLIVNYAWLCSVARKHEAAREENRIQAAIQVGYEEGLRNGHVAQRTLEAPNADMLRRISRARAALDAAENPVVTPPQTNSTPPNPPGLK